MPPGGWPSGVMVMERTSMMFGVGTPPTPSMMMSTCAPEGAAMEKFTSKLVAVLFTTEGVVFQFVPGLSTTYPGWNDPAIVMVVAPGGTACVKDAVGVWLEA